MICMIYDLRRVHLSASVSVSPGWPYAHEFRLPRRPTRGRLHFLVERRISKFNCVVVIVFQAAASGDRLFLEPIVRDDANALTRKLFFLSSKRRTKNMPVSSSSRRACCMAICILRPPPPHNTSEEQTIETRKRPASATRLASLLALLRLQSTSLAVMSFARD